MTSPLTLSPRELRSTIATYSDLLRSHKEVINRLNVYPVPDGDTGTNMTLTIESVTAELGPLADDAEMSEVCKAIAHGSLMGARGNSGVILSQMLRGLVAKFPIQGDVSADLLAESLENADVLARQAVVRIVEGTMLSIARAAAEGAASPPSSRSRARKTAPHMTSRSSTTTRSVHHGEDIGTDSPGRDSLGRFHGACWSFGKSTRAEPPHSGKPHHRHHCR